MSPCWQQGTPNPLFQDCDWGVRSGRSLSPSDSSATVGLVLGDNGLPAQAAWLQSRLWKLPAGGGRVTCLPPSSTKAELEGGTVLFLTELHTHRARRGTRSPTSTSLSSALLKLGGEQACQPVPSPAPQAVCPWTWAENKPPSLFPPSSGLVKLSREQAPQSPPGVQGGV